MKTKILATVAGVTSFLGWFITLTPEQQTSFFAPMIAVVPISWQANIGVLLKLIGAGTGAYAIFRLRDKAPPTPLQPPSPPQP